MKQLLVLFTLTLLSSASLAETWTGYLVDKMCSKRITDAAKAANHSKECLVEDYCAESGYGIVVDGKWYQFNKKGDELAAAILSSTKKEKGIKITVTGTKKKEKINVTNMTEAN